MVVGDIYNIESRVKEISPALFLCFDHVKERYVVFEKVMKYRPEFETEDGVFFSTVEELMHVTTLENEDGSFRPLDQRLLTDLRNMDTHQNDNWFNELKSQARKKRESFKNDRDDYTQQVLKHYYPLVRKELVYGL